MDVIETLRENPVAALVVACEVAFWVFLAAAVVARYVLRRRRLSTALLLCEPLLEVVLLVATVGDLLRGSEATWTHGLAALYLGFTVAFGKRTVHAVDAWVAHRFFGGPEPVRPPRHGPARVRYEWALWLRVLLAWAVACAVLGVLLLVAQGPGEAAAEQREVLLGWGGRATLVLVAWLVFGPVWETFTPRRAAGDAAAGDEAGPARSDAR
ncbi:hypothetical protein [Cellulomonas sp. C5510]|uniref:hypothetical protein n=1 Tax=Cellulomonas sp. C5510 TaxID=2871170 RepID=UPI001C96E5CF|nr:hypothetical protein [Cellulomonas sp. C5510]QZN85327.1 hypothetical protein K5O09_16405 [Cellulomonas sp. C5510]